MNVIISGKNKEILDKLDIEVIKRIDGEYSVDEIIDIFQNLFYNKMIIDITAIKDYQDIRNIQKLSISFDMNKVIMLLDPNSNMATPEYLSKLISMGIYNFTTNAEGLTYLYNNPNSYKDVAQYHSIDSMIVEEPEEKPNLLDTFKIEPEDEKEPFIQSYVQEEPEEKDTKKPAKKRIIGIKSITPGAGATTLTYLMKKQLEKKYNVLAVEVEKRDFIYYNDKTLLSLSNGIIGETLNTNNDKDVILVDLNASPTAENFCDEVLNLIEPSIIKINRLLSIKPKILLELRDKTVILCPSLLSDKDVKDFEYESRLKIFYNLKPVDDHSKSEEIRKLLVKLGFNKLK
ncbi:MAG: hypothetical protein ACI31V_00570 [Bacilli bacterium]